MRPYYDSGGIVIYHADCREVLPSLPRAGLVLTDPPYGIGFAAQPTKWQRQAGQRPEAWDNATPDIAAVLTAGTIVVIWGGNYFALPVSRAWLVWCKPDAPPSMGNVEMAWTNQDRNARYISHSISATNQERVGHPTQKPLRVIQWCFAQFPDSGSVIDPFMGSGTTLRVAKDLGRPAIGIEIDERYCEMAAERLSQEVLDLGAA